MELADVIRSLNNLTQKKFVRFESDKGANSCEKCLQYHGKIFEADDHAKPALPLHPNCRCKYIAVENPQLEKAKTRVMQIIAQVQGYAKQLCDKKEDLLAKTEEILKEAERVSDKAKQTLLAVKISALIIAIQSVIWSIQKLNIVVAELQNVLHIFDMNMTSLGNEAVSLAMAPVELTEALTRLHYSRLLDHDQRQSNLPKSPEEAVKRGFIKAPDSQNRYHRNKGQVDNEKYYHLITGQEVIFDKSNKIVTDPENIGTKNYGSDIKSVKGNLKHILYDVLPYYIWGNSEKDTTPLRNRIWGTGK